MLSFARQCALIVERSELVRDEIADADLSLPVPSCPGWTLNGLVRHLGGGQRWAEEMVRTRAGGPLPDDDFRDLSGYVGEDPAELGAWLVKGAGQLADALRAAGPDAPLWTPVAAGSPGPLAGGTVAFYARRFTHETLMHGADATLALGLAFVVDGEVAADGLDEWLQLASLPEMLDYHPGWRSLFGAGRTVRLHAADTGADWFVDLTGEVIAWGRDRAPAAVTVTAPVADLLLTVYGRRGVRADEVTGDAGLLDAVLTTMAFG